MAVKDMTEPSSRGRKKPTSDKSRSSTEEPSSSPWKINDSTGKRERSTRALPYEIRLREFFVELSGVVALGDSFTASVLESKGEELAYGYAKLAKEDARVKRVIEKLMEGSAWSAALLPSISVIILIGWHYGFIPDKLGVPMTLANGMLPISRRKEQEMQVQAAQEQAAAQARGNGESSGT